MDSHRSLVEKAKLLATEAAELVIASSLSTDSISTKSSGTDMVTEVDRATERYLVGQILDSYPSDSIIGEEGARHVGTSDISWVIDPIDGTTNFIYGFPSYSVSIGIKSTEATIAGAVYNIPEKSLYWAGKDMGAFRNRNKIHVREQVPIQDSLIGTGFSYSPSRREAQARFLPGLIGHIRDIRRAGAASLDLCYLAEGRLDGYYEAGLWPWDYTAASLIVREAGGYVEGFDSIEPSPILTLAATNRELIDFLRDKLRASVPFPD